MLGLLVWCASLWLPAVARAQAGSPASILLHAVEIPESVTPEGGGVPGLPVRATFSLLDSSGTVVKTDIDKVALLLGEDRYTGKFTKLQTDWSVVVLLDTSATLGNSRALNDFNSIRDNLNRSLGSAPSNASFALIPFNDRAPTVQEFTRDREALAKVFKTVKASATKPACLNDGLYEAIAKLRDVPGRRAVLVVTASADNCTTRSIQSVVAYAQQNNVQLYALGVDGYTITSRELAAFTEPTGGLATMKNTTDLPFALNNLLNVLGSQWQALWVLYPPQGPQTAEFDVTMPDTLIVTGELPFVSDREYVHPPQVTIVGTAQPTLTGVRINLDLVSAENIKTLNVDVSSKDTGRPVYQQALTEFTDSILIPSDSLVTGAEYTLTVTALDDQGQVLTQSEPLEFRYQPLEAEVKIAAVEAPTLEEPNFIVTLAVKNLEGVAKYRLWLEDSETGTRVKGAEAVHNAGEALSLPAPDLETGSYLMNVELLGAADQVLATAAPLKVTYQRPGLITRFVFWLRQSTLAIIGLSLCGVVAVVGLGAMVWFLMPKRTEQIKNVELALPEKVRRAPEPVSEPVAPPRPRPAVDRRTPPAAPAAPPPARSAPAQTKVESVQARPSAPAIPVKAAPERAAATPAGLRGVITMKEPALVQFRAEIRKSPFSLGRRADNDGAIPVDGATGVSGSHCVITHVDGQWFVQDDSSTYGTTVNGNPIPKGQPVKLEDGAVLGLGPKIKLQFRSGAGA